MNNDTNTLVAKLEDLIKSRTNNDNGVDELIPETHGRLPHKYNCLLKDMFLNWFGQKIYPEIFNHSSFGPNDNDRISMQWEYDSMPQFLINCIKYELPFSLGYPFRFFDESDSLYTLIVPARAVRKLLEAVWDDYNEKENLIYDFIVYIMSIDNLIGKYDLTEIKNQIQLAPGDKEIISGNL